MKWFPVNKDTIALICVGIITVAFFVTGLLGVLDDNIVKILLLIAVVIMAVFVCHFLFKSSLKNNRPEDDLQSDA